MSQLGENVMLLLLLLISHHSYVVCYVTACVLHDRLCLQDEISNRPHGGRLFMWPVGGLLPLIEDSLQLQLKASSCWVSPIDLTGSQNIDIMACIYHMYVLRCICGSGSCRQVHCPRTRSVKDVCQVPVAIMYRLYVLHVVLIQFQ